MKLAFSTLGCPGWSWDEIFATAKDLGMAGIEVRGVANQMFAPQIKAFLGERGEKNLARLKKAGMEISMLTSGACLGLVDEAEEHIKEAEAYIDFAPSIGAKYVRVVVTTNPAPTEEEDLLLAKARYDQLCDYARGKGVSVLIETAGELANSRSMRSFMRGVDPAVGGVLWDLHHPHRFYGESVEKTYDNIGEWVRYMHVKDSVLHEGKVEYRMMGYGDVPVMDALQILNQNGYDGYVTLEWLKRWNPDLQEPGIVFAHFASYMNYLKNQL